MEPGDLLLTGTPPGVCQVNSGDTIEIGIRDITKATFSVQWIIWFMFRTVSFNDQLKYVQRCHTFKLVKFFTPNYEKAAKICGIAKYKLVTTDNILRIITRQMIHLDLYIQFGRASPVNVRLKQYFKVRKVENQHMRYFSALYAQDAANSHEASF